MHPHPPFLGVPHQALFLEYCYFVSSDCCLFVVTFKCQSLAAITNPVFAFGRFLLNFGWSSLGQNLAHSLVRFEMFFVLTCGFDILSWAWCCALILYFYCIRLYPETS